MGAESRCESTERRAHQPPGPKEPAGGRHLYARKMVGYSRKDMGAGKRNRVPPTYCVHIIDWKQESLMLHVY